MRRAKICLVALALLASSPIAEGQNLLTNGAFDSSADGWTNGGVDRVTWISNDGNESGSGPGCLEIADDGQGTAWVGAMQTVVVTPSTGYLLSGWGKMPAASAGVGAMIWVRWLDAAQCPVGLVGGDGVFDLGGPWTLVEHRRVSPADAAYAVVEAGVWLPEASAGESIARWDDLSFAQDTGCWIYAREQWESDFGGWQNGAAGMPALELVPAGPEHSGHIRAGSSTQYDLISVANYGPPWQGDYSIGPVSNISIELKYTTIDGLANPALRFRETAATNGWLYTLTPLGIDDGLWHRYDVLIDPSWTDQQAETAGWTEMAGPHVSFAATFASVDSMGILVQDTSDGEQLSIDDFYIRSGCVLFADGFESGNASAWSDMVP